jgi:hypothetical protein
VSGQNSSDWKHSIFIDVSLSQRRQKRDLRQISPRWIIADVDQASARFRASAAFRVESKSAPGLSSILSVTVNAATRSWRVASLFDGHDHRPPEPRSSTSASARRFKMGQGTTVATNDLTHASCGFHSLF